MNVKRGRTRLCHLLYRTGRRGGRRHRVCQFPYGIHSGEKTHRFTVLVPAQSGYCTSNRSGSAAHLGNVGWNKI